MDNIIKLTTILIVGMTEKTFASDNYSGVHPEIMEALIACNEGHAPAYGADEFTKRAINKFREHFGNDAHVFFVYNGTGANVLSLTSATRSFNSIICSDLAHINVDESTAPEKFTGCKLITIPTKDGKIYPDEIESRIHRLGDQHHPQTKIISISQTTEYGTVYTIDEIMSIAAIARKYNFYFHMDGSRISNAAVSLGKKFSEFTRDAGVDVLSFGGTKNGMMFGESVVIFNQNLVEYFDFIRKQGMQLHSKMRFISAQFEAFLNHDLWKASAGHSNEMAQYLKEKLSTIEIIKITQSVQANVIFAYMPPDIIPHLQKEYFFYVWNEKKSEVRLMCSFDTTKEDVDGFVSKLKELTKEKVN